MAECIEHVTTEFRHNGRIRKIKHVVDVVEDVTRKPMEVIRNDLYN